MAPVKSLGFIISISLLLLCQTSLLGQDQQRMDKTWGGQEAPLNEAEAHRGELFKEGN